MTECGAPTKAGHPCRSYLNLSASNGLCLMHDPERIAERKEAQEAGANAPRIAMRRRKAAAPRNIPKRPTTMKEAEEFASWLTYAVCAGEIDPRVAREAATALREFKSAHEKRSVADVLARIERKLDGAPVKQGAKRG